MHSTKTTHVFPEDHYESLEFTCHEDGMFDDKSIGFISAIDLEGDECHLPNVKASAVVKFFDEFLQIEDVLRESEHGNKASAETMENLRKIRDKIDKLLNPKEDK